MTVYQLPDQVPIFPHPEESDENGLLAVGGDLSPERLLIAYQSGIFPWYEDSQPILWWSPNPRLILEPEQFKCSRSLKKSIRNRGYEIRTDTCFEEVIHACGETRLAQGKGTWITEDMKQAYINLFDLGYAHSVETWHEGNLVGGLYGIFLGRAFFGESMFMKATDASKMAFAALASLMQAWDVHFIDCQVTSDHLLTLGAFEIPRFEFLDRLEKAMEFPTVPQKWDFSHSVIW